MHRPRMLFDAYVEVQMGRENRSPGKAKRPEESGGNKGQEENRGPTKRETCRASLE